jgi:hypothetical protein
MVHRSKLLQFISIWTTLTILLGGCNIQSLRSTVTVTGQPKITSIMTLSSTKIPSFTPAMTPTPSQTPMPSPVATLSLEEGRALVLDLLANNGGCRLPCFWGITPGVTTWEEAKAFFLQFDQEIWFNPPFAEVDIPGEVGFYGDLNQVWIRFTLSGNQIISMVVHGLSDAPYSLQEFLTVYGEPEEVWIKTFSKHEGPIPFGIVLLYPQSGYAAVYGREAKYISDTVLRACLGDKAALYLWNPVDSKVTTLEEFGNLFDWFIDKSEPNLPLLVATGMDLDTFYQTYKDAAGVPCLETPAGLWPAP